LVRVLVVGMGVVGRALYGMCVASGYECYGYDVEESRRLHGLGDARGAEYMHVAFPFTSMDSFVSAVKGYVEEVGPRMVFIHSTVLPGASRRVYREVGVPVAYTPVRGVHGCMLRHMLFWSKWVSTIPGGVVDEAVRHLEGMGFRVRVCGCEPESLELAKLWETVYRAVMIAAWQELHRFAERFGADIGVVAEFVDEVHRVLGDRPVYYPGFIGGHCLIPNTRILYEATGSELLRFVLESNEARRGELLRDEVRRGVERVRRVAESERPRDYCVSGGS